MKSFVINLASAGQRMTHIQESFDRAGIPFERFVAIDAAMASNMPPLPRPAGQRSPLSKGELGCLRSHMAVWQIIADGADPYGAVFEDDVFIDDRLGKILFDHKNFPHDADLIKLETVNAPVYVGRRTHPIGDGVSLRRLLSGHFAAAGYIVSKSAAQRLVDSAVEEPADDLVFGTAAIRTFTAYQTWPALVVQSKFADESLKSDALASQLQIERRANPKTSYRKKIVSAAKRMIRLAQLDRILTRVPLGRVG